MMRPALAALNRWYKARTALMGAEGQLVGCYSYKCDEAAILKAIVAWEKAVTEMALAENALRLLLP